MTSSREGEVETRKEGRVRKNISFEIPMNWGAIETRKKKALLVLSSTRGGERFRGGGVVTSLMFSLKWEKGSTFAWHHLWKWKLWRWKWKKDVNFIGNERKWNEQIIDSGCGVRRESVRKRWARTVSKVLDVQRPWVNVCKDLGGGSYMSSGHKGVNDHR